MTCAFFILSLRVRLAFILMLFVASACADKAPPEPAIGDGQKAFSAGNWSETVTISQRLISLGKSQSEAYFLIARVRTREGNPDAAIDALDAALMSGLPNKQVIVTSDEFLSLSQNPRFLMLLEKYDINSDSSSSDRGTRIKAGDIEIVL